MSVKFTASPFSNMGGGHNLPLLVEIRLTNLPKPVWAITHLAHPSPTSLRKLEDFSRRNQMHLQIWCRNRTETLWIQFSFVTLTLSYKLFFACIRIKYLAFKVHIEFVHLIRFMLQIGNLRYIYNQKLHKNNFKDKNEKIYIFLRNTLIRFLGILFANQNF